MPTDVGDTHMNVETAYRWRKQLVWGLSLIAIGSAVLLERADTALYASKHAGRNRISSAEDLQRAA